MSLAMGVPPARNAGHSRAILLWEKQPQRAQFGVAKVQEGPALASLLSPVKTLLASCAPAYPPGTKGTWEWQQVLGLWHCEDQGLLGNGPNKELEVILNGQRLDLSPLEPQCPEGWVQPRAPAGSPALSLSSVGASQVHLQRLLDGVSADGN